MNAVVLSVFPGIGLLDRAFEEEGFQIVRGPDTIWGGDVRRFHIPAHLIDGIIGGPPCGFASKAFGLQGHEAKHKPEDLIPEFVRVVDEAKPSWVVMENVMGARKSKAIPPDWLFVKLRDFDCGGFTYRTRAFWIWPPTLVLSPSKRPGKPEYSVLKSSGKHMASKRQLDNNEWNAHDKITLKQAAYLQGWPEMAEILKGMSASYAVGLLGNGVPRAMGTYIAKAIKGAFYGKLS